MAKIEVTMPKMGESITEGTVIVWLKQPGEAVELDEPLLEIGTDKVDTEVPSPAAGVVHEVKVEEGATVEVGSVIAVIETDAEAGAGGDGQPVAAEPAPAPAPAPAVDPAPQPAPASAPVQSMAAGEPVQVVMPKMGESIMEGTIIAWHKQPGEAIEMDETLLEIATDKVDTEVPSPAAGTVVQLLAEEGATVEVGTPIAIIAAGASAAAGESPAPAAAPPEPAPTPAPMPAPASADGQPGPVARRGTDGRFYSPLVRSIAEAEGVGEAELATISGSGRDGRVTKKDLMGYLASRAKSPAAAAPAAPAPVVATAGGRTEIIQMDRMRQIIADHMVRSKATSAHVTSFAEIDVTNLVRLREKRKAAFLEREGVKLTYTPFFVHASIEALKDHPLVNSSLQDKQILVHKDFHIGIAVAIGKTGLVAPVLRFAGQKNVAGLAHAAADLATRARSKKLQPDELQGGTFTVTNVGSLGSIMGTPIINQPQVAILATGAIKKRPMVIEDPEMGDVIGIRHMMYVSLSYDHRIIDGAMAASFLHKYRETLEGYSPDDEV